MAQERAPQPRHVRILPEGVSIQWDDGHHSLYAHRALRLSCLCAGCIGEWPRKRTLEVSTVPKDVYAVEYQTVGRYALQFLWSDAHYTGIYPHQVLRDLCPCPECAAARGSE